MLPFPFSSGRALEAEITNGGDAKANMTLADDIQCTCIVDNPALNKWYGTYPVRGHGVFIAEPIVLIEAKMLLARKLSQE